MDVVTTGATIIATSVAILGVTAKIARIFDTEFKLLAGVLGAVGDWALPWSAGIIFGYFSATIWRGLTPYLLWPAVIGWGIWVVAQPLQLIQRYNERRDAKRPGTKRDDAG